MRNPTRIPAAAVTLVATLLGCGTALQSSPEAPPPRASVGPDSLVAASYNIRHGRGTDDVLDLARTAAVLARLDADVIALQEVDRGVRRSAGQDQPELLGAGLGMTAVFAPFFPYQDGEYGMALLTRLPVLRVDTIPLPAGNEPRVALRADLRLASGRRLVVVNVHFDWVDDDRFRYAQVQALASALDTISAPILLLGDFNDVPGSRTLTRWSPRFAPVPKPAADRFTFSSTAPEREIDHLLVAPAAAWRRSTALVLHEPVASDHRPVVSVLVLS